MILRSKRNPTLKRRMKEIHRELSDVDESLEALADAANDAPAMDVADPVDAPVEQETTRSRRIDDTIEDKGMQLRDERFTGYLSSSFQPEERPQTRERHVQRNKAIVMMAVLVLVIYWFVVRFWG